MDKATNLLTLCYRHCATNLSHQFTDPLRPPVIFELCLEIRRQVVQQAVDVNSRATSRTQTWSRAPDSQPRQCPDLSLSPPYMRHVSESTSNLSPEGSLPLHSGETSRTSTWSRASDSQPPQSPDHHPGPDVSRTPPATRHVSESTPNISSAGSSPNLSPNTSNKLYLEALECIPLMQYDVPLDWTTAYPFLITAYLANLRKYQISTLDYVPQPAHKLLRSCFESVLYH